MSFILIAPFCQQYMTVYLLTLSACYGLLRFWEKLRHRLPEFFLTLGSLVCFLISSPSRCWRWAIRCW